MRVFAVAVVVCGSFLAAGTAQAQCDTTDADGNGIPDVCPPGSNYIEGTDFADVINGTGGDDCIFGFGGTDVISARGGADYICGGDGGDLIFGGGGSDEIFGEGGDDIISGGGGSDAINGGDGNDDLFGGGGSDTISGGDGDDDLFGGGGNDAMSGGLGDDNLDGGGGTNECVEEVPGTSERLDNCAEVTFASVSHFEVIRGRRGVVVTWETTNEIGVAAFRLWREDAGGSLSWVGEVVAAQDGSVRGGRYVVFDPRGSLGQSTYLLEERTMAGGRVRHGPYTRTARWVPEIEGLLEKDRTAGRLPHEVALVRFAPRTWDRGARFQRKGAEGSAQAEVVVSVEGLVEVSADDIASAIGVSADEVRLRLATGSLRLELEGTEIAWEATGDGGALRFIAFRPSSPFASRDRYLVSLTDGQRMESRDLQVLTGMPAHVHSTTARFEENVFPGITGNPDPREDFFFWHALVDASEVQVDVPLPGVVEDPSATLRVRLHGASEHPEQPFEVELRWGQDRLGAFSWSGRVSQEVEVSLDDVEIGATNSLTVAQLSEGEATSVVYLDSVEVDYTRTAAASPGITRFRGAADGLQSVPGFARDSVRLYDTTEPHRPIGYGEAVLESGTLAFAADPQRRFAAFAEEAVVAPDAVATRLPSSLRTSNHDAQYIIIAGSDLVEAAEELADHRRADGYRVIVVDIDDVYWEFADGVSDPAAVREFLSFAYENWLTTPTHAVLVGAGTFDYRDIMGMGGNLVPPMLAQTEGGLFPSDSTIGDVVDDDGVPEIAIGRLPVHDADGLRRAVAAIRHFEATHEDGAIAAVSDAAERRQFESASGWLVGRLPAERTHRIDLDELEFELARDALLSRWEQPLSWVTFVGHGGVDRLNKDGLLTSADVALLESSPADNAPMVVAFTCNLARFDIPGVIGLGQDLVERGLGAGVFAATGWSNHPDTDAFRTAWVAEAFASDSETVGDVVLAAHHAASGAPVEVHRVFALLGDPAVRLRAPKRVEVREPEPGDGSEPSGEPGSPRLDRPTTGSGCQIGARKRDSWAGTLAIVAFVVAVSRRRRASFRRNH